MTCTTCGKQITDNHISTANQDFCSDICHLRFWKEEMPNLGGQWISDNDLKKLEQLQGQERENFYNEINNFILDNLYSTRFIQKLQYGKALDELYDKKGNRK